MRMEEKTTDFLPYAGRGGGEEGNLDDKYPRHTGPFHLTRTVSSFALSPSPVGSRSGRLWGGQKRDSPGDNVLSNGFRFGTYEPRYNANKKKKKW